MTGQKLTIRIRAQRLLKSYHGRCFVLYETIPSKLCRNSASDVQVLEGQEIAGVSQWQAGGNVDKCLQRVAEMVPNMAKAPFVSIALTKDDILYVSYMCKITYQPTWSNSRMTVYHQMLASVFNIPRTFNDPLHMIFFTETTFNTMACKRSPNACMDMAKVRCSCVGCLFLTTFHSH